MKGGKPMLTTLHQKKSLQLLMGLLTGIAFGFLLQKGNVTNYDVIIGQLLFRNMIVVKIMLTAVLVAMIGIHAMKAFGLATLNPKPGSVGKSIIGGLLFGVGFGLLGYCPGTVIGAAGQGSLDALLGGVIGILIGTGLFAAQYQQLNESILQKGDFGTKTLPDVFKVNEWVVIIHVALLIIGLLIGLEIAGL